MRNGIGKTPTTRSKKLASLGVRVSQLYTTGFRQALINFCREYVQAHYNDFNKDFAEDEEGYTIDEDVESLFDEWFGDCTIEPAAFQIVRSSNDWEDDVWNYTIHVYELEMSSPMRIDRACIYSWMADSDGPRICLHIIDQYGRERIIDNDELCCIWSITSANNVELVNRYMKGDDPDSALPKAERTRKWKAAYDALRELGINIE